MFVATFVTMLGCLLPCKATFAVNHKKHRNIVTNDATNIVTKQSPNVAEFGLCFVTMFAATFVIMLQCLLPLLQHYGKTVIA